MTNLQRVDLNPFGCLLTNCEMARRFVAHLDYKQAFAAAPASTSLNHHQYCHISTPATCLTTRIFTRLSQLDESLAGPLTT